MTAKLFDECVFARAHAALAVGDSQVARRYLAAAGSGFADEIDDLIRAGEYEDAQHRLFTFLNPKFPSADECEQHVGEPFHFN